MSKPAPLDSFRLDILSSALTALTEETDIALFRPIFHDGSLVAFVGCIIHYTDVGGMVPGSNPQRATELYQEGLVLPPMKLYRAGRPSETLRKVIAANVRNPEMFFGDLH